MKIFQYLFNFFPEITCIALLSFGFFFSLRLFLVLFGIIVYVFLVIWISSKRYQRQSGKLLKLLVLCCAHAALIFPVLFILSAGLGGASMAVADGVAGSALYRHIQYALMAGIGTLLSMAIVIPWSLLGMFIMDRRSPTLP